MKNPALRGQRIRVTLSLAATLSAVLICLLEHHFTLSPFHPETYPAMLPHKCGKLFLVCLSWFSIELFRIAKMFATRAFHHADI
ncbi:hypothetical protein FTW19_16010 [Terriglobus albidus]|uniref:Uncharacterized protein n=1 Tax=Terriglobus albidus TaxID=1592106 RepID=A0A5B9EH29_9BACT|nr:hypothetical protein [Terriglobus albidus]QEE29366.1 hypothetical protein FTW19_16010 [Terriglobus albidus]